MGEQEKRDPAAPLPVAPQATLPHGWQPPPPWGYPPPGYHPAEPHVDLKTRAWLDVLKSLSSVISALLVIGGIIFAAGQLVAEFRTFKVSMISRMEQAEAIGRRAADSADKSNSTSTSTALKVDELNETIKHLNLTHHRPPLAPKP